MQDKLKDKRIIAGIVVILLLIIGGVAFATSHKNSQQQVTTSNDVIQNIDPKAIDLKMQPGSEPTCQQVKTNNQVKFTMSNVSQYKHVDAAFSYDADVPPSEQVEGGTGKVTQSFEMSKDINGNSFDSGFGLLGTCSKNVCRCDTGVNTVNLVIKLTGKNGQIYQSQTSTNIGSSDNQTQ